jgi:endoglucanase
VPNRLVYTAHDYGPEVYRQGWFNDPKFPENLPDVWDYHWGYLAKEGIAPVVLGEFGGNSVGRDPEGIWQRNLVAYLKNNKIGYLYWSFNGNSGDTGGILKDDWKSVNQDKVTLLSTYQGKMMQNVSPEVVDTSVVPSERPPMREVKIFQYDKNGDDWTKALTPEIHVANRTMQPMDISNLEVRYWFTADGSVDQLASPESQTVRLGQVTVCDNLPTDKVKAEIVRDTSVDKTTDALFYVKLTFAPGTVVPERTAQGVKLTIERKDGGLYYQANDYSYRNYHWPTEWERIGVYRSGQIIWGTDPVTFDAQQRQQKAEAEQKLAGATDN